MRFIVISFFMFFLNNYLLWGQNSKVIIINSLSGYDLALESKFSLFQVCDNVIIDDSTDDYQISYNKNAMPNVLCKNVRLNDICLLLDDKGGVFKLHNINKFTGDTIVIFQWNIYKNGVSDSVIGYELAYPVVNDSVGSIAINRIKIARSIKHNGRNKLNSLHIEINKQEHNIPVNIQTIKHNKTYHGYKPLKVYECFKKDKNSTKKKYFYKKTFGEITILQKTFSSFFNF